MNEGLEAIWGDPIPLFPLPNCVLLPGGALPLHVFEPRYQTMVRHVLAHDAPRAIAIALLRDGYEDVYFTNHAPIFPVVGVGTIVECRELSDGRYNLLLYGRARATVTVEDTTGPYRKAMLVPRESVPLAAKQAARQARRRLRTLLHQAAGAETWPAELTEQIFDAFTSTEALIDVVAFHAIPASDIHLKQRILEEPQVEARLDTLCDYLEQLIAKQRYAAWTRPTPDTWPPQNSSN